MSSLNINESSFLTSTKIGDVSEIIRTEHPEIFSRSFPSQEKNESYSFKTLTEEFPSASKNSTAQSNRETSNTSTSRNIAAGTEMGRIAFAMDEVMRQREMGFSVLEGIDSSKMLSIVVSTVILMATKEHKIPIEYYMWTEQYLKCIKDDKGQTPPNVAGLLDYIQDICKEENFEWDQSWGILPNSSEDDFNKNNASKSKNQSNKSNFFDEKNINKDANQNTGSTESLREKIKLCPNVLNCRKEAEKKCQMIENCKNCGKSKICLNKGKQGNESDDSSNSSNKKERKSSKNVTIA